MSERKENSEIEKLFIFNDRAVTTFIIGDEIWFKAKQVAEILEYKDPKKAIKVHVDNDYKKSLNEFTRGTQIAPPSEYDRTNQQHEILISEPGLYCLIFKSKQKKAVMFRKWIFEEVLPSIRKTGKYKNTLSSEMFEKIPIQIEWFHNDQITQNKFFQTLAPKPHGYIPQSKDERIKREMKKPLDLSFS